MTAISGSFQRVDKMPRIGKSPTVGKSAIDAGEACPAGAPMPRGLARHSVWAARPRELQSCVDGSGAEDEAYWWNLR